MNRIFILFLCALIPACAEAKDLYSIRTMSEQELLQTYTTMLRDACRHGDQFFTNTATDPRIGRWYTGASGEQGIRPMCGMVLANAALLEYSDVLTQAEREEYKSKTLATLRYLVSTHVTGTQKCPDGKRWGNHWQSAFWGATATFGAWLIWDDLDAQLQKDVERVIAHESDRFLNTRPPGGSFNDTKAEENGWNLTCIAIAATMFPNHAHAAAWKQKAIEYMVNTLSAPQDATNATMVDGRKISDWFSGANVHSDFTLENHGFFHPSYIACSSYFLTQTAMYFTYAHQPIPQAATHHLLETWQMYQKFILPNGEAAYPQGMDWELHNLPYFNLFASLASYQKDPLAARMESRSLQYFRAWQEMAGDGSLTFPGSRFGFTRHACTIDQLTWAFLAHKIFGPSTQEISAQAVESTVDGVNTYNEVGIITHRTAKKFVSFSWTNHVMGMLVPIGAGHEGNPDFTVPIRDGFVGSFELLPKGDTKTRVLEHSWQKTTNGFETTGVLLLNGGRLKQTLSITSIGNQTIVYQDRVTALTNVTITQEYGVPVGIENDQITGNTRLVHCQNSQTSFDALKPRPPVALSGSWASIDDRLGLVSVIGSGMSYHQASGYSPGISVCADTLNASYSGKTRRFRAGDEVSHRVAILYTEVTPEQTAKLARSFNIKTKADTHMLEFKEPDGSSAEISLLR